MSEPCRENQPRICVIAFMFWPCVGGAEAQAEKHALQLKEFGYDVTVVTLRHEKQWNHIENHKGLKVIRVGGIYRRNGELRIGRLGHIAIDLIMLLKLWRLRHQFDIVHAMQISSIATVATWICQITHKPIIISIQSAGPDAQQEARIEQQGPVLMADTLVDKVDSTFFQLGSKYWVASNLKSFIRSHIGGTFMLNFLRKSNAYYQVLSHRCYDYLTKNGFRSEQIVHISNGIDTVKLQPAVRRPEAMSAERDILCVARLEYPKGVDVLLHAWGRMMNEPAEWRAHIKPRLRIVGDGALEKKMDRIIKELGIQDSVELLGLRHDIPELLSQAWGFILPSRWEGMPNALLEAMACKLPCIATRVSGSEDVIVDGVNGLLVSPEAPEEMAHALRRLIADSDLAQKMGQKAYATIQRDYKITTIVKQCIELYDQLLTQGKQVLPMVLNETR